MMSSQGCEGNNEAIASNIRPAVTFQRGQTRTTSVFKASVMNIARGCTSTGRLISRHDKGKPPTFRSAKRGLSCHHHAAMTVRSMRPGILPPIRCSGCAASAPALPASLGIDRAMPAGHIVIAMKSGRRCITSYLIASDSRAVAVSNLNWPAHTCSEAQSNQMEVSLVCVEDESGTSERMTTHSSR